MAVDALDLSAAPRGAPDVTRAVRPMLARLEGAR